MASLLKVDALTGVTTAKTVTVTVGSSATQSLERGIAKSWNKLEGAATPSLGDSLNVSGITDNGVGDTNYALVSVFTTFNYCFVGGSNAGGATVVSVTTDASNYRTVQRLDADGSTASDTDNSSALFGALA